jgi:type IV pilus assembly protein PilB
MKPPSQHIDSSLLSLLTAEQAHAFRAVTQAKKAGVLHLFGDETTLTRQAQLRLVLGFDIDVHELEKVSLDRLLMTYYPVKGGQGNVKQHGSEGDIIQFVNQVVESAVDMGASDIHIERYEESARIRFRWEGKLVEKYQIPLDQYNGIISRLKIMAELDIAERRLPQDGRIHLKIGTQSVDIRVSTIPGKQGEKAVLRLLMRSNAQLNLHTLGMPPQEKSEYESAIQSPNGIILITGPTGSGKTTTLYATLNQLNAPERNILTVEDPVEYKLPGINQLQIKPEIGLDFKRALRAFLRQDPDVIMVGEIRDLPTAQIAVRAALTGHLVFSTLHTNNAWDAITRLVDMGIEPYLLAAALRMIVAQRLVRVLCEACKTPTEEIAEPGFQEKWNLTHHFLPQGCPKCYYTGYQGRKASFEVLPIREELIEWIKEKKGNETEALAQFQVKSLAENLVDMVRNGESSLAEILSHLSRLLS